MDDQGEPRGDLAPVGQVVFPFDPALQGQATRAASDAEAVAGALGGTGIERLGSGPVVEERYTVDDAGIVAFAITDLTTGYRQEHVLRA